MKDFEKIVEKFKFLNEYDAAKGGPLLTGTFVQANYGDLEKAMSEDVNLSNFLNMPAEELIEKYPLYGFLIQELDLYKKNTLLDVIKGTLMGRRLGFASMFSMDGSQITGFAAYILEGYEVKEIKMFSLNPLKGGGKVLTIELKSLLDNFIKDPKISKIKWSAIKGNPFNDAYELVNDLYKGNEPYEENGVINYCIEKKLS